MHSDLEQKLVSIRNEIDRENEMIRECHHQEDDYLKRLNQIQDRILEANIRIGGLKTNEKEVSHQLHSLELSRTLKERQRTNRIKFNFRLIELLETILHVPTAEMVYEYLIFTVGTNVPLFVNLYSKRKWAHPEWCTDLEDWPLHGPFVADCKELYVMRAKESPPPRSHPHVAQTLSCGFTVLGNWRNFLVIKTWQNSKTMNPVYVEVPSLEDRIWFAADNEYFPFDFV